MMHEQMAREFELAHADLQWALKHACHASVADYVAQLEKRLANPWITDRDPPAPGCYFVCIHLRHAGRLVGKARRLEEWNGTEWPFVGLIDSNSGDYGSVVVAWCVVPEVF